MTKVLVFPCGTEIGLTIWDSLRHMQGIELWGASSADDHGRFVYKDRYIGGVPYATDKDFEKAFLKLAKKFDYIYLAHDLAWDAVARIADFYNKSECKFLANLIGSPIGSWYDCRVKPYCYKLFPEISPKVYDSSNFPAGPPRAHYPVFIKPNIGNGSKGCKKIDTPRDLLAENLETVMILEYLPGPEFTVDCFTDRHGVLRFCEGRSRDRIHNGIAVQTKRAVRPEFREYAELIGSCIIPLRGQWFFQVKEDAEGVLKLLEVAPRPSGSSVLWTAHNVYLPKLSLLDAMGEDVEIDFHDVEVEMDRALGHRFLYKK